MGNEKCRYTKERINVWVLPNQVRDIEAISEKLGKSKTAVMIEAIGIYINTMRNQGVI